MEPTLEFWSRLVSKSPNAAALIWPDGREVSRKAIDEKSDALSESWLKKGVNAHRLLALNLPNGVDWLIAFLACLKLKVIAVPFDPGTSEAEALQYLKDLGAQALWDGKALAQTENVEVKALRNKSIIVCKLTSGSTGNPKPLFFSSQEMLTDGESIIREMGIRADDINLGMIPWGHSYGLASVVYPLLLQGTRATWTHSPYPAEIIATCENTGATVFPSVPTILRALNRSTNVRIKLSRLRLVISAGSRLDPEVACTFRDTFGIIPKNFYGSTETGGIAFDKSGEASISGRSVGIPFETVKIKPSRGRRFYIVGKAVYRFKNPYAQRHFESSHLAADYGYIDANGELVLEKRAKGLVKIGGRRINPADVESRLEEIEGVKHAIVFGLEVDNETILTAAIETISNREDIIYELRRHLPKRLRPKKIKCFSKFPSNQRGKVDLKKIKQTFC